MIGIILSVYINWRFLYPSKKEGNRFIIEMAALLHDVADEKLNESEEAGMKKSF